MVTVISATNRPGNKTVTFAREYYNLLLQKDKDALFFSLEELPADFSLFDIYGFEHFGMGLIVDKYLLPSDKLVIVMPEYNGGIPGVFKVFIDAIRTEVFRGKKIALVGVSNGRAGNVRGMDSLTNILNYLGAEVLSYKIPVSRAETLMENGKVNDPETLKLFNEQIERLLGF